MTTFISYSWDNEYHTEWVNKLACILRKNAINCLIDQICATWAGKNLEKYMENGINDSRWIICVISDGYIKKLDDLTTGVGKEFDYIKSKFKLEQVIPILKNNHNKDIPSVLEGKYYIDFDNEDENIGIKKLIQRISGFDKEIEPLVSVNPISKDESIKRLVEVDIEKTTYINPEFKGRVEFNYSNNDGLYTIGSGKYEFITMWTKASETSIHVYKDKLGKGCIALIKNANIDDVKSSVGLDFTSRYRTVNINDAILWINNNGYMAITKVIEIMDNTRGDKEDKVIFLYKILEKTI